MAGLLRPVIVRVGRRLDVHSTRNPYASAKLFPARDSAGESAFLKPDTVLPGIDGLPVPPDALLQGYSSSEYLEDGQADVAVMLGMLREADADPDGLKMVLEIGSGSGRMLRAMPRHPDGELWGVDISADHVRWCQNYLSPPMRFATITTAPHLPFEDDTFDLAYAGSIFTHIDELAEAWMLELRRVTAPGGYIYATVHDEHTLHLLLTEYRQTSSESTRRFVQAIVEFTERTGIMNAAFRQFAFGVDPDSQVFHNLPDLLDRWALILDPVATRQEAYSYQTGILLRKRPGVHR